MIDHAEELVIAHVSRDPLRHAATVFDLIHAHDRATTRHIDPMLVDRHRADLVEDVAGMADELLSASVEYQLPGRTGGDPHAQVRARLATGIAQILHHTHEAMIDKGLSTPAARTPLAPMRSLMARTIDSDALAALLHRNPGIVDSFSLRLVA